MSRELKRKRARLTRTGQESERRAIMTPIQLLKILRKVVCLLVLWNVLLTGVLFFQFNNHQETELNQQICNLEAIPQYEITEVE